MTIKVKRCSIAVISLETLYHSPVGSCFCWLEHIDPPSFFFSILGQNEDRIFFGEEQYSTSVFCKSTEQTAAMSRAFQTSQHVAFVAWGLFLSYCFACILCFYCRYVWSTLWDSLTWMICSPLLTLSISASLCGSSTAPLCILDSLDWRWHPMENRIWGLQSRTHWCSQPQHGPPFHV